jgi:hypothetical protein
MKVMPSSTPIVHNVQKQSGLLAQEIMVEIIQESEVSKDSIYTEIFCKKREAPFLFQRQIQISQKVGAVSIIHEVAVVYRRKWSVAPAVERSR